MRRKAKRDLTIEQQLARGPIDLPFLALVLLLTAVGLIMLLSASYASAYYNVDPDVDTGGNPYYYFLKQLVFVVIGVVAMYVVSKVDYQWLRGLSILGLLGGFLLMALVFTPLGYEAKGTRRWLDLGFVFQPSEVMKVAIVMFFSAKLSKKRPPFL
jgi:cell division protein FtsW